MDNPGQLLWLIPLVPFVWHLVVRVIPMIMDENEDNRKYKELMARHIKRHG